MAVLSTLLLGLSIISFCHAAYKPCPILGPDVLPPTNLQNDTLFQSAMRNLSLALKTSFANGTTPYGDLSPESNSLSMGVFDVSSSTPLLSVQHSSPSLQNSTEGVKQVDEHTIFRLGSGSKLLTAYLFFIEAGPEYLERKVTDFVPELASAARNCSARTNPIRCADWSEITLGALLSHMAGIPRDFSGYFELLDQIYQDLPFTDAGLPLLPASARPACNLEVLTNGDTCTREEYLHGLVGEDVIYAPFTTPIYSNAGFAIIGLALENITGRSMQAMFQQDLFDPVGAMRSSLISPNSSENVAIDGPEAQYGYLDNAGVEGPAGGMWSTQHDLSLIGQSILSSKFLTPLVTRQWMKPVTHTSDVLYSVGMPWEIQRVPRSNGGVLDLFTKEGDIAGYSLLFVLSPDYNVGFVVQASGNNTVNDVEIIGDVIAAALFPALETTAKAQSMAKLGGTYAGSNGSNITLTTSSSGPGLVVESWYSNEADLMGFLASPLVFGFTDIRLYPSNLEQRLGNGTEKVSFRAVFEDAATAVNDGGVFLAGRRWGSDQLEPDCASS